MNAPNRLFGPWLEDLAPGLSNPEQVVRERILYSSGGDKWVKPTGRFEGDSMDVDLHDLKILLDTPPGKKRGP